MLRCIGVLQRSVSDCTARSVSAGRPITVARRFADLKIDRP